jgi:hypothetical protein
MIIVKSDLKGVNKKIKQIATDDRVGKFVANEIDRLSAPYVPMDTGMLYQNTVIEPFRVTYTQPYAKRIYFGDSLNFNREKHPLATSHWDQVMMSARGYEITNALTQFIKKL